MFKLIFLIVAILLNANDIKYYKVETNDSIQLTFRLNKPVAIDNYDLKIKDKKVTYELGRIYTGL